MRRRLLLAFVLAVVAVVPAPAQAADEPPAPHVIFGFVTDVTGRPLSNFHVELLLDGEPFLTVLTDLGGFYAAQLSGVEANRRVRLRFEGTTSGPAIALTDNFLTQIDYRPNLGAFRTVALRPGFNLVQWTGLPESIASVTAAIVNRFTRAFAWDATAQQFQTFIPGADEIVNTLRDVQSGQPLWIFVPGNQVVVWEMPLAVETESVRLVAGWNLVPWNGSHLRDSESAFAPLGRRLRGAFDWDSQFQHFRRYSPSLPAALNELQSVSKFSALWVFLSAGPPVSWPQG